MKIAMLKTLIVTVVTAFAIPFGAFAYNTDFSGQWSLDETKSDMGQFAGIVPMKVTAEQKSDALVITKTTKSFDGSSDQVATETLTFDGKDVVSTVPPGTSKRTASAKWSADGKTLTIPYVLNLNFNDQAVDVKGTETWTLSDDGKTLTLTNTSSSSFGDNTYKAVYNK